MISDLGNEEKKKYLKFTRKCRRTKMTIDDFQSTMTNTIFRTTTVAGLSHHEVQCIDDHKLQLDQVITAPMPKIPLDISTRTHWLTIEGKQSTINENLEIISKADLTTVSFDPETIASLLTETSLHQILSQIVLFICEGVQINLMQYNIAISIYLMRMTSALSPNYFQLLCHLFIHDLRNRIVRILIQTFHSERLPLVGLCEMDQKTIDELLFSIIRALGD
ncbi:unnamed protein product [Adineta steineri]|uniref:TAF6 C-terminal HEAT repeat domain-containing protein n=1 Tax=Adineta steineri TaxID=433720 RepID=A0A816DRV9_9BILA|nr:unnamed protein product [Adineta steineri]CAF1641058.1 unnamed protein product [Adineta steineri]